MSQVRACPLPPILFRHILMPLFGWFVQYHAGEALYRWNKGIKPLLCHAAGVSQGLSRRMPHQSRWQFITQRAWDGGVNTHFIPQWSCYHVPILWVVVVAVQSAMPLTSTGWCLSPLQMHVSLHWPFCPRRHPCPLHITWNLHPSSVDTLVDLHRRSHSFPFIQCREVFLAWC